MTAKTKTKTKKATKKAQRRCKGTRVAEVHGQFKNVPCGAKATTTRSLAGDGGAVETLHYCEGCAAEWDSQMALIASIR